MFAREYLGLDWGSAHIDCAILVKKGKVLQLKDYFSFKKESIGDDKVGDLPKIQREFESRKLNSARATVAVPDRNFLVINFQLPKLPPKEKDIAVRTEIEQKLPFPLEECAYDVIRLNPKEGATNDYAAFCVRLSDVNRYYDKAAGLSLTPERVITEMVANMNCALFNGYLEDEKASYLLLDVGGYHIGFTLVTNHLPTLSFSLAAKDTFVAQQTDADFKPEEFLEKEISEIEKVISSFEEKSVTAPIKKILLFGKSPLIDKAMERIPTITKLDIERVNPVKNILIPDEVRVKNPENLISSVALGLALTSIDTLKVKKNA